MELKNKYEILLEFVKKVMKENSDDDFIFDRENTLTFKNFNEPLYKSEFLCIYTQMGCKDILKKIGEKK